MKHFFLAAAVALVAVGASADSKTPKDQPETVVKETEKGIVMSGGSGMYEGIQPEKEGIVMSGGSTMYEGFMAEKE